MLKTYVDNYIRYNGISFPLLLDIMQKMSTTAPRPFVLYWFGRGIQQHTGTFRHGVHQLECQFERTFERHFESTIELSFHTFSYVNLNLPNSHITQGVAVTLSPWKCLMDKDTTTVCGYYTVFCVQRL